MAAEMKNFKRLTPTIWILFILYSTLAFLIATDWQPFNPRHPVNEAPYDPREDLDTRPLRIPLQGVDRDVTTFAPKRLARKRGKRQSPLLLVLHPNGRTAWWSAMNGTQWIVTANRKGFIVAFAQAAGPHTEVSGTTTWNSDEADFKYIATLMDHMLHAYDIDTQRIYVVGVEEGGSFALDLVIKFEKVFAAAEVWSAGFGRLRPHAEATHKTVLYFEGPTREAVAGAIIGFQQSGYQTVNSVTLEPYSPSVEARMWGHLEKQISVGHGMNADDLARYIRDEAGLPRQL